MTEIVSHRCTLRVRYADTDQMQFVYNGKYLEYFEVGRTEMIRAYGMSYAQFEEDGTYLPLIEAHCNYHTPAHYDDLLTIISEVREMPRATMRIEYEIITEEPYAKIASGYTVHAFVDTKTGRPKRPPRRFLEVMGFFEKK